jgi:hypothetical protein
MEVVAVIVVSQKFLSERVETLVELKCDLH